MTVRVFPRSLAGTLLPLVALAVLGWYPREAPSKVAGSFNAKYAEQHPLSVPDAAGHALMLGSARGINRSTGPTLYMDRGEVTNLDFGDLTQGNGLHQGYISISQGVDSMISRWNGKVTTTLSPDKTPNTSFAGAWTMVKGTGRYAGVTGKGSYRGHFTSATEYTADWEGEISGGRLAEK